MMQTHSIRNIIDAKRDQALARQKEVIFTHRPFPQISKQDFWDLFFIEANEILTDRKIFPSVFQKVENQTHLLQQLYYHFTGNEKFIGDNNKGIFISGPNGTGKSIILNAYVNMFRHFNKNIDCRKSIDLGLLIKSTETLHAFKAKPLFIDDLGYESSENSDYKATIRPMANLLFIRYDLGSWTFATGQVPINSKAYLEKYGKAVVDRMKAMFNEFELKGQSLRK